MLGCNNLYKPHSPLKKMKALKKGYLKVFSLVLVFIALSFSISIASSPSYAYIYLDNTYKGLTPRTITNLTAGNYSLKITKSGYYDYKTIANIQSGKVTTISATLQSSASPTPSPSPYY